ncbi:TonB-dependent receptor [Sphingomonas sinipercae]|uniref:TonB-dependent receptor n=1 Tax=Sphingomonas sinipercae TaxID=2714944 RepID=A0A6G7ZKD4_9SPHN|nr:TonB-dependent receptor [Sphingomonas sinipercae]QIL01370.1 TonB-dependent receptor [Sphingomonas sinipercae]
MARYHAPFIVGSCIAAAIAAPAAAQAQVVTFAIPAGPLGAALDIWAKQSGRQVIYRADEVAGIKTAGVQGNVTAEQALAMLLDNSGLSTRQDRSGAFAIVRVAAEAGNGIADGTAEAATIVVTGTRLRNLEAIASPITTYTRRDIERAGRADLADFLQILPQNFSGGSYGLTPDGVNGGGAEALLNVSGAVSPNLRGLGPGSTLTLINGHRVAPSSGSAFVDIGIIPQSAIQRIDIIPDGASAVYGSDAVGGVVNIILRDRLEGAESQIAYEQSGDGEYWNVEGTQSAGTDWTSGGLLVSARYRKRSDLDTSDRSFSKNVPGIDRPDLVLRPDLYPPATEKSLFAVVRQDLSSTVRAEVDGWLSRRDQDQVVGGFYVSQFGARSDQYSLNGSVDIELPRGLRGNVAGGYARSGEKVSQGNLSQANGLEYLIKGDQKSDLWYASGNVGGRLFQLGGGAAEFSLGAEHRSEEFKFAFTGDANVSRDISRNVDSAYGELLLPLLKAPASPFLKSMSVSLAGRYDHYSDVGGAWTGRAGFLANVAGARLRSTYSTAFRAPTLNDLSKAGQLFILGDPFSYYSPDRPGDFARVINPLGYGDLKPERARIFTAGADITPSAIPGFGASATYFQYKYRNRLATPPFSSDILLQPDVYGGVFSPITDVSQVEDLIAFAEANGGSVLFFDPSIPLSDYEYIIDLTFRNIAAQRVTGLDIDAHYDHDAGGIAWSARGAATFVFRDDRKITESSQPNDVVGRFGEQPKFKFRGELTGSKGRVTAVAALNHVSGFKNTNVLGDPRIGTFTTADLMLQFRLRQDGERGTGIMVGVRNLFDKAPPYVDRGDDAPSYDPANANPLGRVFLARVSHRW